MKTITRVLLMLVLAATFAWPGKAVSAIDSVPVSSLAELEEALGQSRGRPALVRVRADWNVSDSELDKQLASACLQTALSEIVWFEWDVTANTDADRQFLEKYEVFGPPAFLLFNSNGNYMKGRGIVGYLPAEELAASLAGAFELPTISEFAECRANESAAITQSWDELIRGSYAYFFDRQEALEAKFTIGDYDRWDIDQDRGTLTLSTGDVPMVEANIAIVGSVISGHDVWEWSWANTSVDPKLSAPIDTVRRYGAEHGLVKLTDRRWTAEEQDGWEMAAIANFLLQGKGVYIAPAGNLTIFVVITDIRNVE